MILLLFNTLLGYQDVIYILQDITHMLKEINDEGGLLEQYVDSFNPQHQAAIKGRLYTALTQDSCGNDNVGLDIPIGDTYSISIFLIAAAEGFERMNRVIETINRQKAEKQNHLTIASLSSQIEKMEKEKKDIFEQIMGNLGEDIHTKIAQAVSLTYTVSSRSHEEGDDNIQTPRAVFERALFSTVKTNPHLLGLFLAQLMPSRRSFAGILDDFSELLYVEDLTMDGDTTDVKLFKEVAMALNQQAPLLQRLGRLNKELDLLKKEYELLDYWTTGGGGGGYRFSGDGHFDLSSDTQDKATGGIVFD